MSRVIFKVDPQREYEYHQLFLDTRGFNRMSLFNGSSISNKERIIRKIECFWDSEDQAVVGQIERKWRKIEEEYFPLVKEITGVDWLYEDYYGYFLAFCNIWGFSNPFNLKSQEFVLTTGAIINPKFFVGHELFHSHYYYVVDKLGMTPSLNKTLFTEGIAALVLSDPKMKKLFAETDFQSSVDSYPVVSKQWPILQKLWSQKIDFENFLVEADRTLSGVLRSS